MCPLLLPPPAVTIPPPPSPQAYTSQILAITMMALQLAEDSISKREKRDQIIDELGRWWFADLLVECGGVFNATCVPE